MTKKYALSMVLLGSLSLSYPVLAANNVLSESEVQKTTKDHLARHHELRMVADKLNRAKTEKDFYDALETVGKSRFPSGARGFVAQDGRILASSDESLNPGDLLERSGPVYAKIIDALRNTSPGMIQVVNGSDPAGNLTNISGMRVPTRQGTVLVGSTW